ncbi:DUF6270 domain-containing protein [Enterococcus sp. LJL98]
MDKINISVWGSCVSRDIFNQQFVADHKMFFNVVSDQQHVSVISLMSEVIDIDVEQLEGPVSPFYKKVFIQDMDKSYLKALKESNPDVILLDFYTDAFYGVKEVQKKTHITNKIWQYRKLNVFRQLDIFNEYSVYNNSLEFISKWKESFDLFMKYVSLHLPNSRVIINKARFSNQYFDEKEKKFKVLSDELPDKWSEFHIHRFNLIWELFDTYAIEKYQLEAIDFDMKEYYCSSSHPWGLFYVHYNNTYYTDIFRKLKEMLGLW